MSARDHFLGKRIAVVGLGPHGETVSDAAYLIKAGALVSVYELKSEPRVKSHIAFLRSTGLANYVCGAVPPDDLIDMDLIILSHEYPRDSSFLKQALAKGIPVEYPETLFFKVAPPVTVIGVMGAAGKATVVSMLAPMLEEASKPHGQGLFVIDHESFDGCLAHLEQMKSGDIVLARLSSATMRELHGMGVSPHVAVFTTVPIKGSYDQSPFEILERQTHNNYIVASDRVIDAIRDHAVKPKAKMFRTKASFIPNSWELNGKGVHDRENAALAVQTAELFKVSDAAAREALKRWRPLKGRLEPVKKVKGVEFYNDTASASAYSTETAIQALSQNRNIVLIFGGADLGHEYRELYAVLPRFVHTVILLPGSGTMKERRTLEELPDLEVYSVPSLEEATRLALEHAKKGDRVVFSPGFDAGGMDQSRKERGERFVKAVRAL